MEPPQSQEAIMLLNGFEIKLSLCSGSLTIEAEEQGSNSRLFTTEIDNTLVKTLTDSLFEDSLSLQQGLQDALNDKSIQVKFIDEGKLLYQWETQHGSKKKCFEFAIPLKEVQLDPLKILERKNEKLQKKVEEQESRIAHLESEQRKLKSDSEKAILAILEKIDALEVCPKTPLPAFQFNAGAKNANFFAFSNNNTSVTINQEGSWRSLYSEKSLAKTSAASFSVRIDKTDGKNIRIGIISANLLQSDACYKLAGAYMYYACNGETYLNGTRKASPLPASWSGSIITVTVDFSANRIEWTVKDGKSWSVVIENSDLNNSDYYPCVELYNEKDQVSFI